MNWWKIKLDASGAILSCDSVESVKADNKLVCYVQAPTKAEACSAAKTWYQTYLEKARFRMKSKREKYQKLGLCRDCGQEPIEKSRSSYYGVKCLAREQARRDKRRGGSPAPKREIQLKPHKPTKHGIHSFPFLLEKFDTLGPEKFREWLVSHIPQEVAA